MMMMMMMMMMMIIPLVDNGQYELCLLQSNVLEDDTFTI